MTTKYIGKYLRIGKKDRHWYKECQEVFAEIFGPERVQLVCNIFAATSINTSLKSNITLFRKAYYEIENGLPIGEYLPNIQLQLKKIREGKELSGRKIRSFAAAMSGDPDAVVVDIWLLRAFDMERKYFRVTKGDQKGRGRMRPVGATDKEYTKIESWVRQYAAAKGYEAREVSSMIWAGVRISKSGDRETHYKTILRNNFSNLFNCI